MKKKLIIICGLLMTVIVSVISWLVFSANNFPEPAECADPNAVTFDDGDFSFATVDATGIDYADGELVIAEVKGNKMLKFSDDGTNFADGTVQKIKIDSARLLSPENLAKVRSVELDVYADATAKELITENGENVKAPGWIGGGAGANVSGDKWYEFGDWEGGEYNFRMSGAVHLELKFLLAESGQCWESDMDEATLMIMRWGSQNEGNFYIDNIVFYDENKNSLPIEKSVKPVIEE
ncbi:MAG: hypothetical protein NC340_03775 [Ruminococcus flavefaciens]|nr:hypothetical protein [Ruminococcus flavefaciens]MCM1229169.1 hypothetical protein [Ruminococcus flavefaciens]